MPSDIFLPMVNFGNFLRIGTLLFLQLANRFGRDNFQEAMKIVHKVTFSGIDWGKFKFMVFDVPNHRGTGRTLCSSG